MTNFLLDMDGVLYHGNRPLPGADSFVARLSRFGHLFITNNSSRAPEEVATLLADMGLGAVDADRILTSAQATALWLSRQKQDFRYFAVGGRGVHEALTRVGREDSGQADFVVIGEGPGLDYGSLTTGINLVLGGALLVATNPDASVDDWRNGKARVLPGGGALVAPFEVATGKQAVIIGKPRKWLFEMAMAKLGAASPREYIMVGDRPDTDIAGAAALGLRTALVRTGRFPPGAPWPEGIPRPDWDVDSLAQLMEALVAEGIFPPEP